MKNLNAKQRSPHMDLIRCIAVLGVICVHFFLNTGFYQEPVIGKRMILLTGMRTFFMYCVPMFILLTGYLMNRKVLGKAYYKGILRTLGIYVIVSLFCILYKSVCFGDEITFFYCIKEILNFSGAPYSWYIEMYTGLFLLIPFLNICYHGISNKSGKHILIVTVFSIITLPTICNLLGMKIIPTWWTGIWPILYYFLGCYIWEYELKISTGKNLVCILLVWIINSAFNVYRSHGVNFEWGVYNDWYGWENLLNAVLIFILIKNLNLEHLPGFIKKTLQMISKWSLGIYLCSWIGDQYVYARFNQLVPDVLFRVNYFIIVVGLVFLISTVLSILADMVYEGCFFCTEKIFFYIREIHLRIKKKQ